MPVAFTVPQDVLLRLVSRFDKVVERRNTIPILSNVLVMASSDGSISVAGTDLDIELHVECEPGIAEVRSAGTNGGSSAPLNDIVRKLGKGDVAFSRPTVSRRRSPAAGPRFKLHELPPEDFPNITGVKATEATDFEVWPGTLTAILSDVASAVSSEETRYYLNGVFLQPGGGRRPPEARRRRHRRPPPVEARARGRGRHRRHEGHHRAHQGAAPLQGDGRVVARRASESPSPATRARSCSRPAASASSRS